MSGATGPRTAAGKARSSRNATRHGLLAKAPLIGGEKRGDFDGLRLRLVEALAPVGELELVLVERIVSCVWRLRRILGVEVSLLEQLRYEFMDETDHGPERGWLTREGVLSSVNRYEVSIERSLFRALHELQRLQAARGGELVALPQVLDVNVTSEQAAEVEAVADGR